MATIRIVIRVKNNEIQVIELIAIGPRSGNIVYDEAYRRLVDSGIGLKQDARNLTCIIR